MNKKERNIWGSMVWALAATPIVYVVGLIIISFIGSLDNAITKIESAGHWWVILIFAYVLSFIYFLYETSIRRNREIKESERKRKEVVDILIHYWRELLAKQNTPQPSEEEIEIIQEWLLERVEIWACSDAELWNRRFPDEKYSKYLFGMVDNFIPYWENQKSKFEMGNTYNKKEDHDKSIDCYKKAVEIKPNNYKTWYNMGIAYKDKKDYDKSIDCYKKSVEIKPDSYETWYNMGVTYFDTGDYDKSIDCYKKAVEIKPDSHKAWNYMGPAYHYKGDYDKAIDCYKKSVEIKPDNYETWYNMGVTYFDTGDYDKAIECFNKYNKNVQKNNIKIPKEIKESLEKIKRDLKKFYK